MNILASYNWIKEYLDTDLPAEVFEKKTTDAGNGVEHRYDLSKRFEDMVVGKVSAVNAHPNADRLKVVKTDIGRDTVEIVCGGANLSEGQTVAVALPGAHVRWHGEAEWVKLEATTIRDVESYGMICAAEELGFDKLQQGETDIWDIGEITDAAPGTRLADALDLNDTLFDIEVTTNRPDAMSIIGQAREGSAVTQGAFTREPPATDAPDTDPFDVDVQETDLCKKYEAAVIDGAEVKPSPWWLQKRLLLAGFKPVNNIVDVTNYVLHEYGQPLHAFDADTLEGARLAVRRAKNGEKITTLDGEERELTEDMLVIADAKRPVAIAGVMGGLETGTTEKSTRIVLESATFDGVSVRKTGRALHLSSNSSQLFEKHLSPEATRPALARAIDLILDVAGGELTHGIFRFEATPYTAPTFPFVPDDVPRLLGVDVEESASVEMLERLGFDFEKQGDAYRVTVPYWRDHDIEHSRDFIEEIARLHGYANIPSVVPAGKLPNVPKDPILFWKRRAKQALQGAGLLETYNYSFLSREELETFGLQVSEAVALENPLSTDQAFMRPSLVPSLLSVVADNQKRQPSGALFEIARVYAPDPNGLPAHKTRLTMVKYGEDGHENFRQLNGVLARLCRESGVREWKLAHVENDALPSAWTDTHHPGRIAVVHVGDNPIGVLAEVARSVCRDRGLSVRVTVLDIDFEAFARACSTVKPYRPIPTYPDVRRDIAFVVDEAVEVGNVVRTLRESADHLKHVDLFDIYRGKGVEDGKKSFAMHLSFRASDRTLEAEEVDEELGALRDVLKDRFNAILRS